MRSRFLAPVLVGLFVVIINAPYLAGGFSQNPIGRQSGLLATSRPGIVGGLDTVDPNDGLSTQALGRAAATALLHGHLPWWNYNEQVGAPLAGGMQSAALFPLTPVLALGSGVLYFHIILEICAGVATYYLLKKLRCGETAAVAGGMLFAANGTFAWLGNAACNPVAFLPLALLGVETAYGAAIAREKRGWFLLAAALALSLYAGFPETAYLDALFVGGWAVVRLTQAGREQRRALLAKLVLGGFVGILLAAPILIAFLDYAHGGYVGMHTGTASTTALPFASLATLVFPYAYGPIFGGTGFDASGTLAAWWSNVGGYLTLPLLLLACIGVVSKGNRALKLFLAVWIVVVVARVYGLPGMAAAFNLVPGVSATAIYRYAQPTFELAAVVLAAFGLDHLAGGRRPSRRQWMSVSSTAGLVAAVAIVILLSHRSMLVAAPHHWAIAGAAVGWGLASTGAIIIFRRKPVVCAAIVTLDALLMFGVPTFSALRSATLDTQPVQFLQTHLGTARFYSLGPIAPNYGSYYGIASINTNNLPLPKQWTAYITRNLDPNTNPVIFDGTYQTNPNGPGPKAALFTHLADYEYVGVKYVVAPKGLITSLEASANGLTSVLDSQTSTIFALPAPQPYFQVLHGDCTVTANGKAAANVNCAKPGSLLRRELYMPGWNATAGGRRLSIRQSGLLFQSVVLPKGTYVLRFDFLPPYMWAAFGLALASATMSGAVYFWPRYKR